MNCPNCGKEVHASESDTRQRFVLTHMYQCECGLTFETVEVLTTESKLLVTHESGRVETYQTAKIRSSVCERLVERTWKDGRSFNTALEDVVMQVGISVGRYIGGSDPKLHTQIRCIPAYVLTQIIETRFREYRKLLSLAEVLSS